MPAEPTRPIPDPEPPPDGHLEDDYDERQSDSDDPDDPAFAAWLVARETALQEQAWALADQFGEEG